MLTPGLGGIGWRGRGDRYAPPVDRAAGNQLPPNTGVWEPTPNLPGPAAQGVIGGNLGANDASGGADPRAPKITRPSFLPGSDPAGMDAGTRNNPGAWRGGIQGFNDKLTVRDRHGYWWRGTAQRTGTTFTPEGAPPGTYNDPLEQPPAPRFKTVNRSVSYQKGSDTTAAQDDLSRPYTWLGEQGTGWSPVYGGVRALYQPYGTRGGVPYPIVSPVEYGAQGDGPTLVWSGPPHGLHSTTPWKGGQQILSRAYVLPQMRPVRIDRPSNSPQAGQSYSQTVQMQGQERVRPAGRPPARAAGPMQHRGRGWAGRNPQGKWDR